MMQVSETAGIRDNRGDGGFDSRIVTIDLTLEGLQQTETRGTSCDTPWTSCKQASKHASVRFLSSVSITTMDGVEGPLIPVAIGCYVPKQTVAKASTLFDLLGRLPGKERGALLITEFYGTSPYRIEA